MRLIIELLLLLTIFTLASLYNDCNSINKMLYSERETMEKQIINLNEINQRLEMTINDFSPIERNSTTTIYKYLTPNCPEQEECEECEDCKPFKDEILDWNRRYDVMENNYKDCYVELEQLQINCK